MDSEFFALSDFNSKPVVSKLGNLEHKLKNTSFFHQCFADVLLDSCQHVEEVLGFYSRVLEELGECVDHKTLVFKQRF